MFASIKNLFFGNNNSDPFDMEQRTRALLAQTHRNRIAGKQSQQQQQQHPQRAQKPMRPAQRIPSQANVGQVNRKPITKASKASLTNLKSDLF